MIGIFGGRFDPIHRAHLAMAKAAADQLQLEEVLWVVSANAVHKSIVASAEHRLEMVRLALEELGDPRMTIDEREIHAAARGEANPSFKTLQSLQEERPNQEWVWILGEDQLLAFTSWQRWEWLAQHMTLAVCKRPGGSRAKHLPTLIAAGTRVIPINLQADALSSSQIRADIARGVSVQALVPPSVASYLAAHTLYGPPEAAEASQDPNSV